MTAHRYWRIVAINNGGGAYFQFVELEFRAVAGVPEQATGGTVLSWNFNNPDQAFDGWVHHEAWVRISFLPGPYIGYEFAEPKDVVEVAIFPLSTPSSHPVDFDIQSSSDGVTWETVKEVRGAEYTTGQFTTFSLEEPVPELAGTPLWRILPIDSAGGAYFEFLELEFRSVAGVPEQAVGGYIVSNFFSNWENAFDGVTDDVGETWAHIADVADGLANIGYDFDDPKEVVEIAIFPRPVEPENYPRDFDIQSSTDGVTWETVKEVRGAEYTTGQFTIFSLEEPIPTPLPTQSVMVSWSGDLANWLGLEPIPEPDVAGDPHWDKVFLSLPFYKETVAGRWPIQNRADWNVGVSVRSNPTYPQAGSDASVTKFGETSFRTVSYQGGSSPPGNGIRVWGSGIPALSDRSFTFEGWAYRDTFTGGRNTGPLFRITNSTLLLTAMTSTLRLQLGEDGSGYSLDVSKEGVVPVEEWFHWALTRDNAGVLRVFIDGRVVLEESFPILNSDLSSEWYLFCTGLFLTDNHYPGFHDDIRFTIDVCRYVADFEVPTEPNPIGVEGKGDPLWDYVSAFVPPKTNFFNSQHSLDDIFDENPIHISGGHLTLDKIGRWGGQGYGYTNTFGSSTSPFVEKLNLHGGPWTIEGWYFRETSTGSSRNNPVSMVSNYRTTDSRRSYSTRITSSTDVAFLASPDGTTLVELNAPGALSFDTWHYLVFEQDELGHLRAYVDGTMVAKSTEMEGQWVNDVENTIDWGNYQGGNTSGTARFSDVRVTKGIARYASDDGHEVPTAPHPAYKLVESTAFRGWDGFDTTNALVELTNGGLTVVGLDIGGLTNLGRVRSNIGHNMGKRYFEGRIHRYRQGSTHGHSTGVGIVGEDFDMESTASSVTSGTQMILTCSARVRNRGSNQQLYGASGGAGFIKPHMVIRIAVDLDNNRIWYAVDDRDWNDDPDADPATNTGGIEISGDVHHFPYVVGFDSNLRASIFLNDETLVYPTPSGFQSWAGPARAPTLLAVHAWQGAHSTSVPEGYTIPEKVAEFLDDIAEILPKFDLISLLAAPDRFTANLDLRGNSHFTENSDGLLFEPNRYRKGPRGKFNNTTEDYSTFGLSIGHFYLTLDRDNAHIGLHSLTDNVEDPSVVNSNREFGSERLYISKNTADGLTVRMTSSSTDTLANLSLAGHTLLTRDERNTYSVYKDGEFERNVSRTSSAIPSGSIDIHKVANSSDGAGINELTCVHTGTHLTAEEIGIFYTALEKYLDAIMVPSEADVRKVSQYAIIGLAPDTKKLSKVSQYLIIGEDE